MLRSARTCLLTNHTVMSRNDVRVDSDAAITFDHSSLTHLATLFFPRDRVGGPSCGSAALPLKCEPVHRGMPGCAPRSTTLSRSGFPCLTNIREPRRGLCMSQSPGCRALCMFVTEDRCSSPSDVSLDNFLWDPVTKRVWMVDFQHVNTVSFLPESFASFYIHNTDSFVRAVGEKINFPVSSQLGLLQSAAIIGHQEIRKKVTRECSTHRDDVSR